MIDFINVVWGANYTDAFLKVSLPLQLCPGNFGSLPNGSARYRLFTTKADWDVIQLDENMKKLQEMIPVEFIEINHPGHCSPWAKLNDCHKQAIQEARKEDRALVFLSPDCLISNNTFQTIVQNANEGKRAIMVMGIRLKKEIMVPLIKGALNDEEILHNGLEPRSLVALSLPNIHPMSESYFFGENINQYSCAVYWKLDNENLLSYGFHLHPIFVWPETEETNSHTIDAEFLSLACPSKEKWKIIQDSDEMCVFEFSDHSRSYQYGSTLEMMPCTVGNIAAWANEFAYPNHWYFFDKPTFIHSSDYTQEWKMVKDKADAFAYMVKLLRKGAKIERPHLKCDQIGRFR